VSPADGAITYSGPVKGSQLEQVKGIKYSLKIFFGQLQDIHAQDVRKETLSSMLSFNETFDSGTKKDNTKSPLRFSFIFIVFL
jgi:phosphatidylserine decarboxylase